MKYLLLKLLDFCGEDGGPIDNFSPRLKR
jgi:hypothetical protein